MWRSVGMVTPPPIGMHSVVMSFSVCVCLSCACLSAIISSELHVRSSAMFCMLHMAVARSSSGGVVMCYVRPVLWMTSYLLVSKGCSTSLRS